MSSREVILTRFEGEEGGDMGGGDRDGGRGTVMFFVLAKTGI